ncbi:MAG: hypothetical protein NTW35_01665 [Candidatus Nomurabacteria bacterium]|nr:hypothetical protein [Candidatus Nomurabacteria bacterium]
MQTQVQNGLGTVQKPEVKKVDWLGLTVQLKSPKNPVLCANYREGVWHKFPRPFSPTVMKELEKGVSVLEDRHDEKPKHFLETLNGNYCFDVIAINCPGLVDLHFPRDQFKLVTDPDSV